MSLRRDTKNRSSILARTAVLAAGAAILLATQWFIQPSIRGVTFQVEGEPERTLTLPMNETSRPGKERIDLTLHIDVLPLHGGTYSFDFDDCLEELTVNGRRVEDESIGYCDFGEDLVLALSGYLGSGRNEIRAVLRDTGGLARFSVRPAGNDPSNLLLGLILLALIVWYADGIIRAVPRLRKHQAACWLTLGGAVLRTYYMAITPFSSRSYDAEAHVDYIRYVSDHLSIPPASGGWEFHQPPLYYFPAGLYHRAAEMLGRPADAIIGDLQLVSLLLSLATLLLAVWISFLLFPTDKERKRETPRLLFIALLSVFPGFLYFASRLTNDALLIPLVMGSLVFLLRWWKTPSMRDWIAMSALLGIACVTKTTAVLLFPVVGVCWIFRHGIRWKSRATLAAVFLGIIVLATSWLLLTRLALESDSTRFLTLGNEGMNPALLISNDADAFYTFNPNQILRHPFNNPWNDNERRAYYWEYFFRSSLFGEFQFHSALRTPAIALLALWLGTLLLVPLGIWQMVRTRSHVLLPLAALTLSLMGGSLAYRISHVCACNQDFRFIPFLIVPVAAFICYGIAALSGELRRFAIGWVGAFIILCAVFVGALGIYA